MRERMYGAVRSTVERAGHYGRAAVDMLVLDDWKALTNANSTPLQRIVGGANLAMWVIPEGKVVAIAEHALTKAVEVAAVRGLSTATEHAVESSAEHVLVTAVKDIRKPHVPHWNKSDIWERPLTEAERSGKFQSADDLKALLGSAGNNKGWHHIAEARTEERFGAERIHNVDNVVPIEQKPTHNALSGNYNRGDSERFGFKPDGSEHSQRSFLEDKSWERHIEAGERELRRHTVDGRKLDPAELRAETLQRFKERVKHHDLFSEQSRGVREAQIVAPPLPGAVGHAGHILPGASVRTLPGISPLTHRTPDSSYERSATLRAQIGDGSPSRHGASPSVERDDRVTHAPDMSHENFAKQGRMRGGALSRNSSLSVERDGRANAVSPGYGQQGHILSADGDRIVQDVGRGRTAAYSRKELEAHFSDSKAFDTMMQPGNFVNVGISRSGVVDVQQKLPGHGWESLGHQPILQSHQVPSPGHNVGR